MYFCSRMSIPIPVKVLIRISANLRRLPSNSLNENLPIRETRRRQIDQPITSRIIKNLDHQIERVEKLEINSLVRNSREISLNVLVDKNRKVIENLTLCEGIT